MAEHRHLAMSVHTTWRCMCAYVYLHVCACAHVPTRVINGLEHPLRIYVDPLTLHILYMRQIS